MKLSEQQRFMLFVLGNLENKVSRDMQPRMLKVAVSKAAFIEILKKSGIAKTQERALYKNLEGLEKLKVIEYNNKDLFLTEKGKYTFEKTRKALEYYLHVLKSIENEPLIKLTSKAKAKFSF